MNSNAQNTVHNLKILYSLLTFLFISLNSFSQSGNGSIEQLQLVLKNNVKDSLYVFGKWDENGGSEIHLKYLGIVKSQKENFKIITFCWIWGQSKRATNRILIFDKSNTYIGNYYVGMKHELPEKISNNQLVFLLSESSECDKGLTTRLSFDKGIPDEFFLECKNGYGDLYSFSKEQN